MTTTTTNHNTNNHNHHNNTDNSNNDNTAKGPPIRQGIVLKHRNSLQESLCPVVICPYLCRARRVGPLEIEEGGVAITIGAV